MNTKEPLISIVVPVYNVEKYIEDCLRSILAQTYKNIEVICVDDASPDKSVEIIKKIQEEDDRVKIVTHDVNKGLFRARLTGADAATGDYLCFVDSDDSITIDWIRLLLKKSIEENADMVVGNTIQKHGDNHLIDNNYMSLLQHRKSLEGEAILKELLDDEGYCFLLHTVWNKLYSMELWKKARPEYEAIEGHLIMAEDIAYSTVLFYYAKKFAFSNHDGYIYFRNDNASTSAATISLQRIKKYITDVVKVFNFVEAFLKKHEVFEKYEEQFNNFKDRNFRIQSNILYARGINKDPEFVKLLCDGFGKEKIELSRPDDFYYYDVHTIWESNKFYTEELKKKIIGDKVDVLSFDVFDTLILRPFLKPEKLFEFLEYKYAKFLTENNILNFKAKRKEAEDVCRKTFQIKNRYYEDCSLAEIYETFANLYHISQESALKLMNFEEQTDLELCRPRQFAKTLIELARLFGKTVIITTDTYYSEDFIKVLLSKNGFDDYDNLYVSSKYRKLKGTGNLFKQIKDDYPKSKILHIGDNWNSDIIKSQENGLDAEFIPNTYEISLGIHKENYTGDVFTYRANGVLSFDDVTQSEKQLSLNSLNAVSINRLFDKPFTSWNRDLKYNNDLYLIGNYVFGAQLLAISNWMYKIAKEHNYKKIVFLARDGYVPMMAFNVFQKYKDEKIEVSYFNISRRSVLPVAIDEAKTTKVIQEYMDIKEHTVRSLMDLFGEYLDADSASKDLEKEKILIDGKIGSYTVFEITTTILDKHYDFAKLHNYIEKLRAHMKPIFDKDVVCFDLGYSGRIQSLICKIVEHPVDVFFVHSNGIGAEEVSKKNGFKIYNFLDYTPKISSIIREYLFSELAPSCIGYDVSGKELIPLFDDSRYSYIEHFIQNELIRSMVDFIDDYCSLFAKYDFMFEFKNEEVSIAFESYVNNIPEGDTYMYRCSSAEDMLYFNYKSRSIYNIWLYNLKQRKGLPQFQTEVVKQYERTERLTENNQFLSLPKVSRALIVFIASPKLFFKKIWGNIRHPKNRDERAKSYEHK